MRRSYFSVCAYALVLLPFFLFIAALLCLVWERSSALLLCFLPFQYLCVLALLSLIRQTQALEREIASAVLCMHSRSAISPHGAVLSKTSRF